MPRGESPSGVIFGSPRESDQLMRISRIENFKTVSDDRFVPMYVEIFNLQWGDVTFLPV